MVIIILLLFLLFDMLHVRFAFEDKAENQQ